MWTYFQNIQTEFVVEQVLVTEKGFTTAANSKASYWHYFISVCTRRTLRRVLFSFREDVSGTRFTEAFLSFLPCFSFLPPPPFLLPFLFLLLPPPFRFSRCSARFSTFYVVQANLDLLILLPPPLESAEVRSSSRGPCSVEAPAAMREVAASVPGEEQTSEWISHSSLVDLPYTHPHTCACGHSDTNSHTLSDACTQAHAGLLASLQILIRSHLSTDLKLSCFLKGEETDVQSCWVLTHQNDSAYPLHDFTRHFGHFCHGNENHILPVINWDLTPQDCSSISSSEPRRSEWSYQGKSPTPIPRKAKHTLGVGEEAKGRAQQVLIFSHLTLLNYCWLA